jgi:hypothetical protein
MLQENEKNGEASEQDCGKLSVSIPGGKWPGRRTSAESGTTEGVPLVEIQAWSWFVACHHNIFDHSRPLQW